MTTPAPRMEWKPLGWEVTVPPGRYFLGDPCYAIADDDWMTLLESTTATTAYFEDQPAGELRGHQVLAFSTKWGDGEYHDQDGGAYSVDAGLIGLVPEALAVQAGKYDLATLGRWVEFTAPETCTDDKTGLLVFGPVKIDTDPDPEEDDDWHEASRY